MKQSEISIVSNLELSVLGQWASSAATGSLRKGMKPLGRSTTVKLTAHQRESMVEGGVLTGSKGEAGSAVTTKYASSAHATNYQTTQLLLHVLETHCIS